MDAPDWRTLLENVIADAQERQRVANVLGVNPVTLARWVRGESIPRRDNLQRLVKALPAQQQTLTRLLANEFPAFDLSRDEDVSEQIPAEIYSRILNTYVTTQDAQRTWYLSDLIMQLALGQLDPNNLGAAITIAHCMPPSGIDHKVRSLRQMAGRGTYPWNTFLDQEPLFLGIEALAGYAAAVGHLVAVQSRDEMTQVSVRWEKWEESAVASPVLLGGRIAGCLIVSSTQPGYFLEFRQKLIRQYTELLTLAFRPEEFYAHQQIELSQMPSDEVQNMRISRFRQRVSEVLQDTFRESRPITMMEAEQIVWADLEAELLDLPDPYVS